MCDDCAPKLTAEMASAQAHAKADAARAQLYERAQKVDYAGGVDMSADSVLRGPEIHQEADPAAITKLCSNCGVNIGHAKFCPECGTPAKPDKPKCGKCGFQPETPVKFCPECGNKL